MTAAIATTLPAGSIPLMVLGVGGVLIALAVLFVCLAYGMIALFSFGRVGAGLDRAIASWAVVVAAVGVFLISLEAWWLSRPAAELPPPTADQRLG